MRRVLLIFLLIAVHSVALSQIAATNWAGRISCKTKYPWSYFINPHASAISVLEVDGRKYQHVRGLGAYYIPVRQINSIVFVTDEQNHKVIYHIFNMSSDQDTAIPAEASIFGYDIGAKGSEDSATVDSDGKLILCNFDQNTEGHLSPIVTFSSMKDLFYIDLEKKSIVSHKTLYFDKLGKLIEERDAKPPF
jgi:hypothetical protein